MSLTTLKFLTVTGVSALMIGAAVPIAGPVAAADDQRGGEQAGQQKAPATSDARGDRAEAGATQASGIDDQDPLSAHPS